MVSCGVTAQKLVHSELWLKGPVALMGSPMGVVCSQICVQSVVATVQEESCDASFVMETHSSNVPRPVLPVERWGTL